MMRDKEKTLTNLMDKQNIVYLSLVDEQGFPNTKAMLAPCKREGIRTFYLHTNTSSRKVAQFKKNPKACLYFCDTRFFRGVNFLGEMEVVEDMNIKSEIWADSFIMYYSQGVEDPDFCVLKFTAFTGRFYANYKTEDFVIE